MIIKKEFIKRQIDQDFVLVPTGKTVLEYNGLFVMNDISDFIWNLLPQVETEEEICRALVAEYEVSEEEAAADVAELLGRFREMGII